MTWLNSAKPTNCQMRWKNYLIGHAVHYSWYMWWFKTMVTKIFGFRPLFVQKFSMLNLVLNLVSQPKKVKQWGFVNEVIFWNIPKHQFENLFRWITLRCCFNYHSVWPQKHLKCLYLTLWYIRDKNMSKFPPKLEELLNSGLFRGELITES